MFYLINSLNAGVTESVAEAMLNVDQLNNPSITQSDL
jgi:hypothetical protein